MKWFTNDKDVLINNTVQFTNDKDALTTDAVGFTGNKDAITTDNENVIMTEYPTRKLLINNDDSETVRIKNLYLIQIYVFI